MIRLPKLAIKEEMISILSPIKEAGIPFGVHIVSIYMDDMMISDSGQPVSPDAENGRTVRKTIQTLLGARDENSVQ